MKFDFEITSSGQISNEFKKRNVFNFMEAQDYVKQLPYKRNKNKYDLCTVFTDDCGTCSTKHALLKQLAIENHADVVKLKLGIFKMNSKNTPGVTRVLNEYNLDCIPEAHNYLKWNDEFVDCTGIGFVAANFVPDLLEEIEIEPDQITEFKVTYHLSFLTKWLSQEPTVPYSIQELFDIREKCIAALQKD